MPLVYFNHSGAGLPAADTLKTVIEHLQSEAMFGPMEAGAQAASRLDDAYLSAARLLGCRPQEVAFGSGHGQLYGDIVAAIPLAAGETILVSRQEWVGNLICLQQSADLNGAKLSLMASDCDSAVDVAALAAALTPDVRIVALTWIGAGSAVINPAAAMGRAISESGSSALFIIDASQAVGQLPVDVEALGCDALIACGRKFLRGPRGTSLAYISPRLASRIVPRKIDNFSASWVGGDVCIAPDARAFEVAEGSVALKLGLACAIDNALSAGTAKIRGELDARATALRRALASLPAVQLHDLGKEKAACVTFTVTGFPCDGVQKFLADRGIAIGMNGHAYTPYDMEMRGIDQLLRASVHLDTTEQDISALVMAISELADPSVSAETGKSNEQ